MCIATMSLIWCCKSKTKTISINTDAIPVTPDKPGTFVQKEVTKQMIC